MQKRVYTVAASDPRQLHPWLVARTGASAAQAASLVQHGAVWIGTARAQRNAPQPPLVPGTRITVFSSPAATATALPVLPALFEDEHLIVLCKPPGLPTQPTRQGAPSVLSLLAPPLFPVHRLDADASGLLVLGKTRPAAAALSASLAAGTLRREYLACVDGLFAQHPQKAQAARGQISLRIAPMCSPGSRPTSPRYAAHPPDSAQGLAACTQYQVLLEEPAAQPPRSLVWLCLQTGRTHQVRVHLAALGHPLQGDRLYGGSAAARLYLHAFRVRFLHPTSGKSICLQSLPMDLAWPDTQRVALPEQPLSAT